MKQRIFLFVVMIMSVALLLPAQTSFGRGRGNGGNGTGDCINLPQLPNEDVSQAEREYLLTMREEEKLARDVYNYLAARWELACVLPDRGERRQAHGGDQGAPRQV